MFNILMEFKSFSLIECRGALKDNLYILNVESEESMNNPDIPVFLLRGLTWIYFLSHGNSSVYSAGRTDFSKLRGVDAHVKFIEA